MRAALDLARPALGSTWPNPTVGCLIVSEDRVVGRGVTAPGGRPHAETQALAEAGGHARGATAYVTLEPCDHHGVTGPCSEALIAAGVARVVVACGDPDPRVSGAGLRRLAAAGVAVIGGVLEAEAIDLNEGFFRRLESGRPMVMVKLASSLDGRIATTTGASKWITGAPARDRVHALRATHDAVMVGSGTARADDPELTCRLPHLEHRSPVRVVLDGGARLDPTARLVTTARVTPTWVITRAGAPSDRVTRLIDAGVVVIAIEDGADGHVDIAKALAALGARGVTRLMVEGGGGLVAALARADLIDRLVWFRAPILIGGDGVAAVAGLGIVTPDAAPRFETLTIERIGDDIVESLRARR